MRLSNPLFFIPLLVLVVAIPLTVFYAQSQQVGQNEAAGNCTTLTLSKPLTLDKQTVAYGETISGSVTYTNNSNCTVKVLDLAIGTRASGYPHSCPQGNCPYFVPGKLNFTVAPGQSVTLNASFTPPGQWPQYPPGQWSAYPSYTTAADPTGVWHDGNTVYYTITKNSGGGTPVPTHTCPPGTDCHPFATPTPICPPGAMCYHPTDKDSVSCGACQADNKDMLCLNRAQKVARCINHNVSIPDPSFDTCVYCGQ